jgi:hypothetical protein
MSDIKLTDLTTNEIEGGGIFDDLMRSVKVHLKEELSNSRITDVNYSSVYLGALQSTMAQAVQFLLEKDKVGFQNELINTQQENLKKEGELLDVKIKLAEAELYNAKYQECALKTKIAQTEAETQSILQNTANTKTQASLITKNILKAQAEVDLYKQRRDTEAAQVADKVGGVPVGGIVGMQREMYRNQSNGYLRLAEQQNARMMLDAFAVLQSNAGLDNFPAGTNIQDWGVTPDNVSGAISTLSAGVKKQNLEHTMKNPDNPTNSAKPAPSSENVPKEPVTPSSCTVKNLPTS